MSVLTVENLLEQIEALPEVERLQLVSKLNNGLNGSSTTHTNGTGQTNGKPKPDFKYLKPIPTPDYSISERWLAVHEHEYDGEWIALDGDRLIAHGKDGNAVFAAARADGAYLPLVFFVIPVDEPPFV